MVRDIVSLFHAPVQYNAISIHLSMFHNVLSLASNPCIRSCSTYSLDDRELGLDKVPLRMWKKYYKISPYIIYYKQDIIN